MYPNPTAVQRCAAALQRIAAEHAAAAQHHGGTAMLRNTSESSADEPSSAATAAAANATAAAQAAANAHASAANASANGSSSSSASSAATRAEYGVAASTASRQVKVGASLYGGSPRAHDAMHGDHASYQTSLISGTRAPSSSTLEADYVTLSSRKGGKK